MQQNAQTSVNGNAKHLEKALQKACGKIAPLWSLENFVAVNPYLGMTDQPFEKLADQLSKIGGVRMTMPLSYYLDAIKEGKIGRNVLESLLEDQKPLGNTDLQGFLNTVKKMSQNDEAPSAKLATVADVAEIVTGKDWDRFFVDRISLWAASYFDNGQAAWSTTLQERGPFEAWKTEASVDRSPKLMGLKAFKAVAKALPDHPVEAAAWAIEKMGLSDDALAHYLHRLLLRLGGWAAYAAHLDWNDKLYGKQGHMLSEFLCVLISWEACLYSSIAHEDFEAAWEEAKKGLAKNLSRTATDKMLTVQLILQEAYDRSAQQQIVQKLNRKKKANTQKTKARPKVQAIFCIDVRSEIFRRNFERVNSQIDTIGFAGFFGFPINYVPLGHEHGNAQCPALVPAGPTVKESIDGPEGNQLAIASRSLRHQVHHAWKSFQHGAISCFSFVSPVGLSYLPKLLSDSFGITRPVPQPDSEGISKKLYQKKNVALEADFSLEDQVNMAEGALKAMSLTENFAKLVMIVGHGANTVNNPHATGLDCGACGGRSGEANARVAAAVLNNPKVRSILAEKGLEIPEDTHFLACLHDTTLDKVSIFREDLIPAAFANDVAEAKGWLEQAGKATRMERAVRFQIESSKDVDAAIEDRSKDWAQVRPEWGLAGCSSFIIAPRHRTQEVDLQGKAFLHSYDWHQDKSFSILEQIMTAPMVVASWINLQYYASTVDNLHHGAGNKTLHNVTGGLGVLEGYAGDLRTGLPWQSLHDGENFQHEPLRLKVIIEAPKEEINAVLSKHPEVQQLCDNGWIQLLAMDEKGKVSHQYTKDQHWQSIEAKEPELMAELV